MPVATTADWLFDLVARYVRGIVRRPAPMLMFSCAVLLLLTAIGFSPVPPLEFETSTRSLQPKNIRAGQALETIMKKCRSAGNRCWRSFARQTRRNCMTTGKNFRALA